MVKLRALAPFAYAALWSAQTVSTKAFVTRHHRSALQVFASVTAAELIKLLATVAVCGFSGIGSFRARVPACAALAVACASLAYPTLAVIPAASYVPLLGIQLAIRLVLRFAAYGPAAVTPRRAVGSFLGCVGAMAAAVRLPRWSATAVLMQAFLVCFAEALDDDGDGAAADPVSVACWTGWTAALLTAGAASADLHRAALTVATPVPPYAAATVALMAASGVARGVAVDEAAWPVSVTAMEASLLVAGGVAFLGETITAFEIIGAVLVVVGTHMCYS